MERKGKVTLVAVCFGVYIAAALFTIILCFGTYAADKSDVRPAAFPNAWYYDEAMSAPADLRHPVLEDGACSFYSTVPEGIQKGDGLWFKAKNAYIEVRIGGEARASISEDGTSALYGKTPGTDWVCVPLETLDASAEIMIDFHTNYSDGSAYLDDLSVGNMVASVRGAFSDVLFGSGICVLMMFLGVIIIIAYAAIRPFAKNAPTEFLYLGLGIFFTSIWTMSELRVFQIFTARSAGTFHNLTCMTMMLIPIPIVLYFRKDLDKSGRFIVPVLVVLSTSDILICNILHFTGVADFHETLIVTHITLGAMVAAVVYVNIRRIVIKKERSKTDLLSAMLMALTAVCAALDMALYKMGISKDSAFFMRIALFLFVVSLGVNSVMYVIQMMQMGMRAEIIARLAYEDGLTGLGNRTAYTERLEEIAGKPATIFVFDVNNLKYVNDNIGHLAGDELIKAGADMISSVFGKIGNCYRTGGDEFVCLAEGMVNGERYSQEFYSQIRAFNKTGALGFPLMIALGYEVCAGNSDIKKAVEVADFKMYQKKKELKQNEGGKYDRASLK